MEERFNALLADAARREDLAPVLSRLEAIEARLGPQIETGALGHAPCAFSPRDTGSPSLSYLARDRISDDGVRVYPWSGPEPAYGAEMRAAALQSLDFNAAQPMDAASFRLWAADAFALSQVQGCRHYVVLNETGRGDAATYADLRDAVEDNFYIYRVAP